jgi:hypothetical protein
LHARKLTGPKTPAEAALCFEPRANIVTRIRHPNMPDSAIASCTHGRPMQDRDRCRLDVGWARLRASLPSYRWASRCRMRGARGDLHSPKDAWTPQPHGKRQDRHGMDAASSPFRQSGVSRLAATEGSPADRRDRPTACDTKRVFRGGRSTRKPRSTPSRERSLDSDASSKAARRRERTTLPLGHIYARPSSWRAGRLTPPPRKQRMRAA